MQREVVRVGKRGKIVLPAKMRRRLGLGVGAVVVFEQRVGGIFVRPAVPVPAPLWTAEEKAGFLLNNSIGVADYRAARAAVRKMGLDPDRIPHEKPDTGRAVQRRR